MRASPLFCSIMPEGGLLFFYALYPKHLGKDGRNEFGRMYDYNFHNMFPLEQLLNNILFTHPVFVSGKIYKQNADIGRTYAAYA